MAHVIKRRARGRGAAAAKSVGVVARKAHRPHHSRPQRERQGRAGTVAVYDGRIALGVVRRHGSRFAAITMSGRTLGAYSSLSAAADALQRRSER